MVMALLQMPVDCGPLKSLGPIRSKGIDPAEQCIAKQVVVSIPIMLVIQGNNEQVGFLQRGQYFTAIARAPDVITEIRVDP